MKNEIGNFSENINQLQKNKPMKNIAIFASGNGTNAQRIVEYFSDNQNINVCLILSNKKDAFVLQRAKNLNISSIYFNRSDFYETEKINNILKQNSVDLIVLAGFLWLIPLKLIKDFSGKIINIHPALLPKFGGKGMYGDKVHKTVIETGEKETGISIHFVNEKYDEGKIIFQKKIRIQSDNDHESLAKKIHQLEYKYFPQVIESLLNDSK